MVIWKKVCGYVCKCKYKVIKTDWEGSRIERESPGACKRPGDGYRDTETRGKARGSGGHPCPVVRRSGGWEKDKARVSAHVVCVRMSV